METFSFRIQYDYEPNELFTWIIYSTFRSSGSNIAPQGLGKSAKEADTYIHLGIINIPGKDSDQGLTLFPWVAWTGSPEQILVFEVYRQQARINPGNYAEHVDEHRYHNINRLLNPASAPTRGCGKPIVVVQHRSSAEKGKGAKLADYNVVISSKNYKLMDYNK